MPAFIPKGKTAATTVAVVGFVYLTAEEAWHGHRQPEPEEPPAPVLQAPHPVACPSGTLPTYYGWPAR